MISENIKIQVIFMVEAYAEERKKAPVRLDKKTSDFLEQEFTVSGRKRIEDYLSGSIPPANTTFGRVAEIIRESKGKLSKDQMDAVHASHQKAIEHPKPIIAPGMRSTVEKTEKLGVFKFIKPLPTPRKELESEEAWRSTKKLGVSKTSEEVELGPGQTPSERFLKPTYATRGQAEKKEGKYEHLVAVTVYDVNNKQKTYGVAFNSDVKTPTWKDVSAALASKDAGVSLAEKGGIIRSIPAKSEEYAHLKERALENDMKIKLL